MSDAIPWAWMDDERRADLRRDMWADARGWIDEDDDEEEETPHGLTHADGAA